MRRREKFVIAATLLSLALLGVQYTPLEWRYWVIATFTVCAYFISGWTLSDDLQRHEWLTIVPLPAFYATAVSLFYFLLPEHLLTKIAMLVLFGIGMYALFLTGNIFSVAKGRTIQLVHAAHAIGLLFTLFISILITNILFTLRLSFASTSALVALVHFPLILMSLWSIRLENRISREILGLTTLLTFIITEVALVLTFFPIAVWHASLFVMALLYIGLGIIHNYLRGRLFRSALTEYSLVAAFVGVVFVLLFPWK